MRPSVLQREEEDKDLLLDWSTNSESPVETSVQRLRKKKTQSSARPYGGPFEGLLRLRGGVKKKSQLF